MTIHALFPQCAEPREQCFELFRMHYSQNFLGLHCWTPLERTPQLHNGFSPHYDCRKTGNPKQLLDTILLMYEGCFGLHPVVNAKESRVCAHP